MTDDEIKARLALKGFPGGAKIERQAPSVGELEVLVAEFERLSSPRDNVG